MKDVQINIVIIGLFTIIFILLVLILIIKGGLIG